MTTCKSRFFFEGFFPSHLARTSPHCRVVQVTEAAAKLATVFSQQIKETRITMPPSSNNALFTKHSQQRQRGALAPLHSSLTQKFTHSEARSHSEVQLTNVIRHTRQQRQHADHQLQITKYKLLIAACRKCKISHELHYSAVATSPAGMCKSVFFEGVGFSF